MEPGEPDGLHDRLRARHVERHLVLSGDLPEPPDVLFDDRMVRAEEGAQAPDLRDPLLDTSREWCVWAWSETTDVNGLQLLVRPNSRRLVRPECLMRAAMARPIFVASDPLSCGLPTRYRGRMTVARRQGDKDDKDCRPFKP